MTNITASDAAKALRAIPSERRAQASRENGKKGGRPAFEWVIHTPHRTRTFRNGKEAFQVYRDAKKARVEVTMFRFKDDFCERWDDTAKEFFPFNWR